ncbi:PREDICTED: uncharacterized protein LOC103338379 isoform X2 [Prunus mume]|nr:PREDICTED: uncharacterized protein LOC103338379 isoform X2 [Prunus mume]
MAAAVLTSVQDVQDHALTMASGEDKLLGKISEIEKSLAALSTQHIQLVDLKKSIWEELHLLRASRARAHKHGAVHPYPSLPMFEHASMTVNRGEHRSVFLVMTCNGENTGALYEVKFKYGGEVGDMGGGATLEPVDKFSRFKTEIWNKVEVDTHDYTPFRGRAVVVGKTIYAMNLFEVDEIIAFSLKMNKHDDGSIAYSLIKLCKLDGLKIASPPCPFEVLKNDYFVHLGNHDFFHVTTGNNFEFYKVQHLCITTFQIFVREDGRHMIETLHSTVLTMDIEACGPLMVTFGFTP